MPSQAAALKLLKLLHFPQSCPPYCPASPYCPGVSVSAFLPLLVTLSHPRHGGGLSQSGLIHCTFIHKHPFLTITTHDFQICLIVFRGKPLTIGLNNYHSFTQQAFGAKSFIVLVLAYEKEKQCAPCKPLDTMQQYSVTETCSLLTRKSVLI